VFSFGPNLLLKAEQNLVQRYRSSWCKMFIFVKVYLISHLIHPNYLFYFLIGSSFILLLYRKYVVRQEIVRMGYADNILQIRILRTKSA
jgi:hypothetical protein